MNNKSEDLQFAISLVEKAIPTFKGYYGSIGTVWKSDNTPVTDADIKINQLMVDAIKEIYPDDGVCGEELITDFSGYDRVWTVDPIDGTQLFDNDIPLSSIVLTLNTKAGVELAVVAVPGLDDLYYAQKGEGAYKNTTKLCVNNNVQVAQSYFATSSRMPKDFATPGVIHDRIESEGGKDYNFRSYTYCAMKVAEGKFSGCVLGNGRLFDISGPALIVEEAGGKATNLSGGMLDYKAGSNGIIVTNGHLHEKFLNWVRK